MLQEALRYLGIHGEANEDTLRLILECMETVRSVAAPKMLYRIFSREEFTPFLIGEDLKKHLEGAEKMIIMAATLGHGVDLAIKKMQAVDMARAAALDACATAFIENYCNENMPDGLPAAMRFSPGYGDYPLSVQPRLLKALHAEKIGISALESYMLLPAKSITAIVGIGQNKPCPAHSCARCSKTACAYRQEET